MILVLGGTVEGRRLAAGLAADGYAVLLSLGGRTANPRLPEGVEVRCGGFGGAEGLATFLREHDCRVVADATHPFAEAITANAAQACVAADAALVRLERPSWADHPNAAGWSWVDGHAAAAARARSLGQRVLLTVGRQHTLDYVDELGGSFVLARVAEAPQGTLPDAWRLVEARGPFILSDEVALMREHRIDVLVTKDAGGVATEAKLDAARGCGAHVVMLRRPSSQPEGTTVMSVDEALVAVKGLAHEAGMVRCPPAT